VERFNAVYGERMKSKKAPVNSSEPIMAHFKNVSAPVWTAAGNSVTIDEFIESQRQYANASDLAMLCVFSNRLVAKLKGANADHYPGLAEAIRVIVRILESPTAQQAKDPLPDWLAESAFAAGYLLKGFDLIPDHFPEIGLADDALILRLVIQRNQAEFRHCLAECTEHAIGKKS
jgi:uncharacterized membrane protein YkvA (DUF1232 family)